MEFKVYIPDMNDEAMDADGESVEEAARKVFEFWCDTATYGESFNVFVLNPAREVVSLLMTRTVRTEPREADEDEIADACEVFEVERPAQVTAAPSGGLRTLG